MLAFWTRGFPCQGTGKENLWCPEYHNGVFDPIRSDGLTTMC